MRYAPIPPAGPVVLLIATIVFAAARAHAPGVHEMRQVPAADTETRFARARLDLVHQLPGILAPVREVFRRARARAPAFARWSNSSGTGLRMAWASAAEWWDPTPPGGERRDARMVRARFESEVLSPDDLHDSLRRAVEEANARLQESRILVLLAIHADAAPILAADATGGPPHPSIPPPGAPAASLRFSPPGDPPRSSLPNLPDPAGHASAPARQAPPQGSGRAMTPETDGTALASSGAVAYRGADFCLDAGLTSLLAPLALRIAARFGGHLTLAGAGVASAGVSLVITMILEYLYDGIVEAPLTQGIGDLLEAAEHEFLDGEWGLAAQLQGLFAHRLAADAAAISAASR